MSHDTRLNPGKSAIIFPDLSKFTVEMRILLFVILGLVIGTQVLGEKQKKQMDKISQKCKSESGITQDLIDKAIKGDLVDDPKWKAFSLCVSEKVVLETSKDNGHALEMKAEKGADCQSCGTV